MTFRQISGLLLLAAAAAACRDGSGPSRVGTVEADADSLVLRPGEGATLTARVLDGDGDPLDRSPVRWASSDTTVATVSGTGAVSAVRTGSAEITVESGSERDVVPVRVAFASTLAADSVNVHVNPFDAVLFTMPAGGEVVQLAASEADSGRIVVRRTPAGGGAEDLVWLGADGRPVAATLRTGARIGFTYNDPSGPVWVTRNGGSWLTLAGLAAAPPPGALPAAPAATASSVRLSTGLTVGNSGVSVPYPGATVAYQLRGPGALDWFYARAAETAGARYDAELPTGPAEGAGVAVAAGRCTVASAAAARSCAAVGALVPRVTAACGGAPDAADCQLLAAALQAVCQAAPGCGAGYRPVDRALRAGPMTLWTSTPDTTFVATGDVPAAGTWNREERVRLRLDADIYLWTRGFGPDDMEDDHYEVIVRVSPPVAGVPVTVRVRPEDGGFFPDRSGLTEAGGVYDSDWYTPGEPFTRDTVFIISGDEQLRRFVYFPCPISSCVYDVVPGGRDTLTFRGARRAPSPRPAVLPVRRHSPPR